MRKDKNKAISLRKRGKSYNEIRDILDVPKSTLSMWLRDIKMSSEAEKRFWSRSRKKWAKSMTEFNRKQGEIAKEKAEKRQQIAIKEVGKLSKKELLLVGSALYWAEGYKKSRWSLRFTNSDSDMVRLMMRFFREICEIPEPKIKAAVQIHSNTTSREAINYWSKISGISKNNFNKTYSRVTPSSKFKRAPNTLPYGTLNVSVHSVEIVDKIRGWIKGVSR